MRLVPLHDGAVGAVQAEAEAVHGAQARGAGAAVQGGAVPVQPS
jgi:hypothetical protein